MTLRPVLFASLVLFSLAGAGCADSELLPDEAVEALAQPAVLCPFGTPVIYGLSYAVPSPGELLVKSVEDQRDIAYVTGDVVDVTIESSRCASVIDVSGFPLTASDPIEPSYSWAQITGQSVPTSGESAGHLLTTVRLVSHNFGRGHSPLVVFTLKGPVIGNTLPTATASFTLAQVADIGRSLVFSESSAELTNGVIASVYAAFGDDGYGNDDTPEDGFKDPDYTQTKVWVKSEGIYFKDVRKLHGGNVCDVTFTTTGRFTLAIEAGALKLNWLTGPDVEGDAPFYCGFVLVEFVANQVIDIFGLFDDNIRDGIANTINSTLPDCDPFSSCLAVVDHFEYAADELRIVLDSTIFTAFEPETVTVNVPYDTAGVRGMSTKGLAIPKGKNVAIAAKGLVKSCEYTDEVAPACDLFQVGSRGLFNWNVAAQVPVPYPWIWLPEQQQTQFFHERLEARAGLSGLGRKASLLPIPWAQPGTLVVRRSTPGAAGGQRMSVATPCVMGQLGDAPYELSFGPNDFPQLFNGVPGGSTEYGQGEWKATLLFTGLAGTCF